MRISDWSSDVCSSDLGVQLDNTFDALYEVQDKVRVVHTRHEQGAAYMALGYAQATGKVGTCIVVPGPGVLNTGAALSTAAGSNEIGRASCRERVCQYVWISGVAG